MKFKVKFSMYGVVTAKSKEEAREIAGLGLAQMTPADMDCEVTRYVSLRKGGDKC
jgi:hypothetical protein